MAVSIKFYRYKVFTVMFLVYFDPGLCTSHNYITLAVNSSLVFDAASCPPFSGAKSYLENWESSL